MRKSKAEHLLLTNFPFSPDTVIQTPLLNTQILLIQILLYNLLL